jgi:hypothetical protein
VRLLHQQDRAPRRLGKLAPLRHPTRMVGQALGPQRIEPSTPRIQRVRRHLHDLRKLGSRKRRPLPRVEHQKPLLRRQRRPRLGLRRSTNRCLPPYLQAADWRRSRLAVSARAARVGSLLAGTSHANRTSRFLDPVRRSVRHPVLQLAASRPLEEGGNSSTDLLHRIRKHFGKEDTRWAERRGSRPAVRAPSARARRQRRGALGAPRWGTSRGPYPRTTG